MTKHVPLTTYLKM